MSGSDEYESIASRSRSQSSLSSTMSANGDRESSPPSCSSTVLLAPAPTPAPPSPPNCISAIMCFQHCVKGSNILCLQLPKSCPLCCQVIVDANDLRVPPFQIPSPFDSASNQPCSIVIKPSRGSFLGGYSSTFDLHAGLTDSKGIVHEYDKRGLTIARGDWSQCVPIQVSNYLGGRTFWDFWDYTLEIAENRDCWRKEVYDADDHNCFTFVLEFMKMLQISELSGLNRTQFCEQFICPKMRTAARYITLHRKLQLEHFYVKKSP